MIRTTLRFFTLFFVQILAVASLAEAQGGLSQAVLQVSSNTDDARRVVDGHLYGAVIAATITNGDGIRDNFGDNDRISLTIRSRNGKLDPLTFPGGSRSEFEAWARQNASKLLGFLFPAGLSSSVLGRGAGELQAQQVLLTTAFATENVRELSQGGRSTAGGMIEFEMFTRDDRRAGDSVRAWNGLYNVSRTVSLQGRFVQQHEGFSTSATAFSADLHPFVQIDGPVRWRIGATANGGLLYSRSNAMDLGSLEFGGGGFVSAFKDLGRVRIGGGTILQGSKSYIPPVFDGTNDGLAFLADEINKRSVQYDLAYGATAGFDTSSRTTVIVKLLESHALSDNRDDSRIVLAGLSYRFGIPSVNFGYKHYSTTGLHSHSVYAQGNFNW